MHILDALHCFKRQACLFHAVSVSVSVSVPESVSESVSVLVCMSVSVSVSMTLSVSVSVCRAEMLQHRSILAEEVDKVWGTCDDHVRKHEEFGHQIQMLRYKH